MKGGDAAKGGKSRTGSTYCLYHNHPAAVLELLRVMGALPKITPAFAKSLVAATTAGKQCDSAKQLGNPDEPNHCEWLLLVPQPNRHRRAPLH